MVVARMLVVFKLAPFVGDAQCARHFLVFPGVGRGPSGLACVRSKQLGPRPRKAMHGFPVPQARSSASRNPCSTLRRGDTRNCECLLNTGHRRWRRHSKLWLSCQDWESPPGSRSMLWMSPQNQSSPSGGHSKLRTSRQHWSPPLARQPPASRPATRSPTLPPAAHQAACTKLDTSAQHADAVRARSASCTSDPPNSLPEYRPC